MSRGLRNNNPGNIRLSTTRYEGEIEHSDDSEFKQFESMPYGYRAMFRLLYVYQTRHGLNTLRGMISRYAPSNENDTNNYIRQVSKWSSLEPDAHITSTNRDTMIPFVAAMSRMENGVPANMPDVEEGWKLFIKGVQK